ncbi:hypothetical protein [Brachybacterium paraconglomeratum]|uniref:hypothetical protein n=1 Tax=Brachybacterium paraconglomeratum TaxID=173362 RepID=UPI0031E56043
MSRVLGRERDLWVLTLENPGGVQVPIASSTTSVTVDGHGKVVQVLAVEQGVPRGYRIVGARSEVLAAVQ